MSLKPQSEACQTLNLDLSFTNSLAVVIGTTTYFLESLVQFAAHNITGSFIGTSMCLMVLKVKITRGRHQFSEDSIHTLRFRTDVSEDVEVNRAPYSNDVVKAPPIVGLDAEDENKSGS